MLSLVQHAIIKNLQSNSLGIPREDMPQVFSKDLTEFKEFLTSHDIHFHAGTCSPSVLNVAQNQFDTDKISKLMGDASATDPLSKPILISADNYVLDGNHRLAACLLLNRAIPYIKIELPFKELFTKVKDFENVAYKKLGETIKS